MFPGQEFLEKVSREIKNIPNKRGEHLRQVHYGCYLLCSKAGLRVSEAVRFDLGNKAKKGLYRIERPKGKKERLVYIPKQVIRELRKNNWKPNQTNRWNFYHFLRRIKRELNISQNIELTPHTLRRSFTTYQAEKGMPLPLLQKLLGHSSIRTTALYWRNIYQEENDDLGNILTGKNWLENKEKKLPEPTTENFPQAPKGPEPLFIDQKPVISNKKPVQQDNSLLNSREQEKKPAITNYQPKSVISKVPVKQKLSLNITNKRKEISEQLPPITSKSEKEQILLAKIRNLEEKLRQTQTENENLKIDKESYKISSQKAEAIAKQEKQRADNYQQQLKTITKTLYQWQKVKHYQQLEQEQKAQVEQLPPWKSGK